MAREGLMGELFKMKILLTRSPNEASGLASLSSARVTPEKYMNAAW